MILSMKTVLYTAIYAIWVMFLLYLFHWVKSVDEKKDRETIQSDSSLPTGRLERKKPIFVAIYSLIGDMYNAIRSILKESPDK